MLIGAGLSLVGVLIVARFMPARDTNVSEDDESQSARELELEGPLAPTYEPSGAGERPYGSKRQVGEPVMAQGKLDMGNGALGRLASTKGGHHG